MRTSCFVIRHSQGHTDSSSPQYPAGAAGPSGRVGWADPRDKGFVQESPGLRASLSLRHRAEQHSTVLAMLRLSDTWITSSLIYHGLPVRISLEAKPLPICLWIPLYVRCFRFPNCPAPHGWTSWRNFPSSARARSPPLVTSLKPPATEQMRNTCDWATCSHWKCPRSLQAAGTRWPPQVPSNPNLSVTEEGERNTAEPTKRMGKDLPTVSPTARGKDESCPQLLCSALTPKSPD